MRKLLAQFMNLSFFLSMSSFPSAESYLADIKAALENLPLLRSAIRGNAEIYAGVYFFAFVGCVAAALVDLSWITWLAHFLVTASFYTAWRMHRTLGKLARAHHILREGTPLVLGNHRILNYVALALLGYAWIALLRGWPAPWFAVLLAAFINFMHYCGYPNRPGAR